VPITISCCAESEDRPQRLDLQQRAVEEGALAKPFAALLPREEAAEDDKAADDQERHQREAERRDLVPIDRWCGDRLDPAPGTALQDPEHDQPERDSRERGAAVVQLRRLLGLGRALHAPVDDEHRDHHRDLTDEDVPPAPGRRHVAADQRPSRDRRTRGAADHSIRERALLALVVRGGQRGDRRDDQHRAKPLDPRPADQQHREVRAERRDQRAQPVHGQAEAEGTVTPEDVAELRANEHERRHHERVHRDRALHASHRRVQVCHDLRDRDVHHARIQHHDELGRREDD
jgi:hypothetical protein